eukprot:2309422-Amphidinium_carterae.2
MLHSIRSHFGSRTFVLGRSPTTATWLESKGCVHFASLLFDVFSCTCPGTHLARTSFERYVLVGCFLFKVGNYTGFPHEGNVIEGDFGFKVLTCSLAGPP